MAAPLLSTSVPGIYRRGSRYVVVFRDPTGRQRKRAAATMAEARSLKAQLNADVIRGEYREQSRMRFEEYAEEGCRTYTGRTNRGIRSTTLAEYQRCLDRYVMPTLGKQRLTAIEPRDIKRLAAGLSNEGLSASTVRNAIAPVRALFATAVEEGLVRSNPCSGLRLASGPADPENRARALTPDELRRLLSEASEEWRLLLSFLAQTGLRIGELVVLRWGDLDLESRRLRVRRRLYRGTIDTPKSRFGVRDVPLSIDLAARLAKRREAAYFQTDADLAFPTRTGTPMDATNVLNRAVKPAARLAGVPWAGLHTLRHTCASTLFRSGWNAKQVQMVLGHHSPAFTLATYVHLIPDDLPEPVFPAEVLPE